jgi:hypothetical protein
MFCSDPQRLLDWIVDMLKMALDVADWSNYTDALQVIYDCIDNNIRDLAHPVHTVRFQRLADLNDVLQKSLKSASSLVQALIPQVCRTTRWHNHLPFGMPSSA